MTIYNYRNDEANECMEWRRQQALTKLAEVEFVAPGFACPKCGERDIDKLVWFDDEWVTCQRCGTDYKPGEG